MWWILCGGRQEFRVVELFGGCESPAFGRVTYSLDTRPSQPRFAFPICPMIYSKICKDLPAEEE